MANTQVDETPTVVEPKYAISSWEEADTATLSAKERELYKKRKAAIQEYFTTDITIEELALEHQSTKETVEKLVKKCLTQHKDGTVWGFRALVPGVTVVEHVSELTAQTGPIVATRAALANALKRDVRVAIAADLDQITQDKQQITDDADDEDTAKRAAGQGAYVVAERSGAGKGAYVVAERSGADIASGVGDIASGVGVKPNSLLTPPEIKRAETLLIYTGGRLQELGKKSAQQRRLVRKRWVHEVRVQRHEKRFRKTLITAVIAALLLMVVMPVGVGLAAYGAYNNIRGLASDGISRLLDVKNVITLAKTDPMAVLNTGTLQRTQRDFNTAESDFLQLQDLVSRPEIQSAIEQFAPNYGSTFSMAQRLVQVGLDASRMGSELSSVALIGANILHSSPLASGTSLPLITVADVTAVEGAMVHALYYIDDIQFQMSQVQLKALPISDRQKTQLTSVLTLLPKARDAIVQAQGLVGMVSWLLGIGQKRRFLVQTMDRAELRPGGGFTGQYGILEIRDGRMAPFSLRDVALLDYAGNGIALGRLAPLEYSSWMNFGNWGLRDANLSGDFPTTARLAMQVFQEEGGGPVDGDIALTPTVIAHILDITGPIKVAEYGEVITSKNLEDRIHYYQQDYRAIAIEEQKTHSYDHAARKSFTSLVGKLLLERVRHLSVKQLLQIAKGAVKDMQSHDLEMYFTNPAAEAWLLGHGYSASIDTFSKQDGFMVVQANISISKASQYVHTTEHDAITLDAQGGATHVLTITLDYNQTGPVYGLDTYADYIRVYAPASAQFLNGDGFDTGQQVCDPSSSAPPPWGVPLPPGTPSSHKNCIPSNSSYPSSARYCPVGRDKSGPYALGARGYTLTNTKGEWTVDSLGAPTALSSDLPGFAMFGGLTETPKNCISTITVSWYVPYAARFVAGQASYSILVEKQGGYIPTVELVVDASAIKGLKPFSYSGDLVADRVFSVVVVGKKR